MQIDFHHGVTYVASRLAGLNHHQAEIVAYSAQYVDDATNHGAVKFKNGAMYNRVSSAHKVLDYRNFDELANHQVWIPFHFLPGNGGLAAGQNPEGSFVEKLICRPNSFVAQDMVAECIKRRHLPYSLHLLGITAHVFMDTWAHQGFAGVVHKVNRVEDIFDDEDKKDNHIWGRLKNFFGDQINDKASGFVSGVQPLGHGAALSQPDKPFLKWSYKDGFGRTVIRDNPVDFIEAAEQLCRVIRRFIAGDSQADVKGLPDTDKDKIETLIRNLKMEDGDERHVKWLEAIENGEFSFGAEELSYVAKGEDSWKHVAIGTVREKDIESEEFDYKPEFLQSNWKHFHDALQLHRYYVIHDILPRYDISVA